MNNDTQAGSSWQEPVFYDAEMMVVEFVNRLDFLIKTARLLAIPAGFHRKMAGFFNKPAGFPPTSAGFLPPHIVITENPKPNQATYTTHTQKSR